MILVKIGSTESLFSLREKSELDYRRKYRFSDARARVVGNPKNIVKHMKTRTLYHDPSSARPARVSFPAIASLIEESTLAKPGGCSRMQEIN